MNWCEEWQNDGQCDDINNNLDCSYDGGDCCGRDAKSQYCFDCSCKSNSRYKYVIIFFLDFLLFFFPLYVRSTRYQKLNRPMGLGPFKKVFSANQQNNGVVVWPFL